MKEILTIAFAFISLANDSAAKSGAATGKACYQRYFSDTFISNYYKNKNAYG